MKKIAIISTHPIQYNAPWFKLLNERKKVAVMVFYTWGQLESEKKHDPGFGKEVKWDIPLLEGYLYTFVKNTSKLAGSHHRKGIINPSLNQEIEQWKPDAILVFGWNFVSHFKCIQYFHKKVPVIFRGDSTLLRKEPFLKSIIKKIYLKWVYHFIDKALYVGIENKKYFLEYGLKENQLIFAPHAIDNKRFSDLNGAFTLKASDWKKDLNIPANSIVVLYAGKLEKIKNPFIIIEFANRLINEDVYFILTGNGPLENELKMMAAGNSKIKFLDFQNQLAMPVVYRLADFFMLSSVSETWGLGINEAMACGRAIIVRNTCGCAADLVKNERNGFVFDAENLEQLHDQFLNCIYNTKEQQWKKMGAESEKIIKNYSFENIVLAIENFFENKN